MSKPKDANLPTSPADASKESDRKKKKEDEDKAFDSFLSEVESDLRDEVISKLWKKYSAHIVGSAAALVAAVFGYQMYAGHITERREQMAMTYAEATDAADVGNMDEALARLSEIGDVSGEGYSAVARLAEASLLIEKGDTEGALAVYAALASDSGADPVFRDLAVILKTMHSMDAADPKVLEPELAPLAGPGQPFRHSALELAALLAAKQGERDRAQQYLAEILGDPAAPQGIRARARDLSDLYTHAEGIPSLPSVTPDAAPTSAIEEPPAAPS